MDKRLPSQIKYILALLLLVIILLLLYLKLSQKEKTSQKPQILPPTAFGRFKLNSIKFKDTIIFWFPIEFTTTPHQTVSFKATAVLDNDEKANKFEVLLGASGGNVKSGRCQYDAAGNQFTENSKWFVEPVDTVTKLVKPGVKALLRIYIPANLTGSGFSYSQKRLDYLLNLMTEVNTGSLNQDYLVVPDEICIGE